MTYNQYYEHGRELNYRDSWKDSLKYSTIINNYTDLNKNKLSLEQFNLYYNSILCLFMKGLKQRKIPFKNNYKFVRIWNTFINSAKKCKDGANFLKISNQLNYVSFKNNSK